MALGDLAIVLHDVKINGDLKFHGDDECDVEARRFCSMMISRVLIQHMIDATHKRSQAPVLLFSRESSYIIAGACSGCEP